MRAILLGLVLLALNVTGSQAGEAHILKVLPQFLDERGRSSISPSLYERDAYQAALRRDPARITGLRFKVQWKSPGFDPKRLTLRVELRTVNSAPERAPLRIEAPLGPKRWRRGWTFADLAGDDFRVAGEVIAWRAVLVEGDREVAEQRSFLW